MERNLLTEIKSVNRHLMKAVATYQAMLAIYIDSIIIPLIELPKADVNQRVKFIINNITSLS